MSRHKWSEKGPWRSSHDRRQCVRCGLWARKFGQRCGWLTHAPGVEAESYSETMPPCPGDLYKAAAIPARFEDDPSFQGRRSEP